MDDTILKFMARPYFIVSQMIILPLVGFHFMKILGAKLTFVYYAHIGIMGLAQWCRPPQKFRDKFLDFLPEKAPKSPFSALLNI